MITSLLKSPKDVEERDLMNSDTVSIVHLATLNVQEIFNVPESTAVIKNSLTYFRPVPSI